MRGGQKRLTGKTDEGMHYRLLRTPDEAPPIIVEVKPPWLRKWTYAGAQTMIGQAFGIRWGGRVLLLRVVGASVNPTTKNMELICK